MALLKVICWALIFFIRIRFPPGKSLATILNNQMIYHICHIKINMATSQHFLFKYKLLFKSVNQAVLTSIGYNFDFSAFLKRLCPYSKQVVQCNERRHRLFTELERIVEYHEDSNVNVKQSLLMALLDLSDDDKSILTQSIKGLFLDSNKKTMMIERETMYPF